MQVVFNRTGGIAPMPRSCQLDTDTLPPPDAAKLKQLVESSGILSSRGATLKNAQDMHYYTVEITTDGQKHRVTFDHVSVPPPVQPLVDFLLEKSQYQT